MTILRKHCSKCAETLDIKAFPPNRSRKDGLNPYCRDCRNAYARQNRPAYKDLSPEQKAKSIARSKLKMKIKRGHVIKATRCTRCGSPKNIEAHHPDYKNPYDVEWLCRACHKDHHSAI